MLMGLNFPDDFFRDEEREGFLVPEQMKRAWAAELKVLDTLKKFFEKYHIRYFAEYGTLLGAVRHKGFIPWDDDIDITMLRPDYMKLIAHADELPEPYQILSIYTSDTFYMFDGVAKNDRHTKLVWSEERVRDFYGCPFIINLDINPLDYIPRDPGQQRLQKLLYNLAYALVYQCVELEDVAERGGCEDAGKREAFEKGVEQLKAYLKQFFGDRIFLDETRPIRNALCRAADQIAMLFGDADADLLNYYPHMVYSDVGPWRKKEWYRDTASLPFETTEVSVCVDWEELVKATYGENYMTPVRGAAVHDYPFYKKQEEYFKYLGYLE